MNSKANLAALVTALGMVSCGFEDMANASSEVSLVIDFHFETLRKGTWSAAYDSGTTAELRAISTREAWDKLGLAIRDRLGSLVSKSPAGLHIQSMNGVLTAKANYSAQFEKGTGTISAVLRKSDGKWLLQSFHVNSPVFDAPAGDPCSKCGKTRPSDAAFCPGCGAKAETPPAPAAPKKD